MLILGMLFDKDKWLLCEMKLNHLLKFAIFGVSVQYVYLQEGFQKIALQVHNKYRVLHKVEGLALNDKLNQQAQKCAIHYSNRGKIDHSCPFKNGVGENIWMQSGGNPSNDHVATDASNKWYSENAKYDYKKDWQKGTGHFTQMVWKSTKEFGFGVARKGKATYACGLYSPAGNVKTKFNQNVFKP